MDNLIANLSIDTCPVLQEKQYWLTQNWLYKKKTFLESIRNFLTDTEKHKPNDGKLYFHKMYYNSDDIGATTPIFEEIQKDMKALGYDVKIYWSRVVDWSKKECESEIVVVFTLPLGLAESDLFDSTVLNKPVLSTESKDEELEYLRAQCWPRGTCDTKGEPYMGVRGYGAQVCSKCDNLVFAGDAPDECLRGISLTK